MTGAVLDTNVIVSALLQPAGTPAGILDLAFGRQFRWYISQPILTEYAMVLARERLGIEPKRASAFLRDLRRTARMVVPTRTLHLCADPSDDRFLECALEARADYLVTGNVRHFPKKFQDIRVILPRQFLTVLAAEPH